MQIRSYLKLRKPESEFEQSVEEELFKYSLELSRLLNRGLTFSDNFNGEVVEVADTGAADSEISVAHSLKRIPTDFEVSYINKAGIIYASSTAWTDTTIYLKCNAANCLIRIKLY